MPAGTTERPEGERRPWLLLVEDDPVIGEATQLNLQRYDHEVTWAEDGRKAWHASADPISSFQSAGVPLGSSDFRWAASPRGISRRKRRFQPSRGCLWDDVGSSDILDR